MMVCLPMIQKTADNYKKAIQISIKKDSIDVQEYLNKEDNPPYKFKSFHGLMKGYREAVLVKMVGEWWIAVRMPEDEEAKKKYQKNHIANKAVGLLHGISYTLYEPYLKKCGDEFNQLAANKNVSIFKKLDLISVNKDEIKITLTSSGTTGQDVSKIYLDSQTSGLQQKALVNSLGKFLGNKRLPMLVIDAKSTISSRKNFSASSTTSGS